MPLQCQPVGVLPGPCGLPRAHPQIILGYGSPLLSQHCCCFTCLGRGKLPSVGFKWSGKHPRLLHRGIDFAVILVHTTQAGFWVETSLRVHLHRGQKNPKFHFISCGIRCRQCPEAAPIPLASGAGCPPPSGHAQWALAPHLPRKATRRTTPWHGPAGLGALGVHRCGNAPWRGTAGVLGKHTKEAACV